MAAGGQYPCPLCENPQLQTDTVLEHVVDCHKIDLNLYRQRMECASADGKTTGTFSSYLDYCMSPITINICLYISVLGDIDIHSRAAAA